MSVEYDLVCEDCKETVWVAQDGLSGYTFYSGEPDTMRALGEFLYKHQNHRLEFRSGVNDGDIQYSDFEVSAMPIVNLCKD